jgi:hypothetical protein
MNPHIVSWLPGIGQSIIGAIVVGCVVLMYRRVAAARRSAAQAEFERAVVTIYGVMPAASSEAGRLSIYIAYRLARLVAFGTMGIGGILLSNVTVIMTFSWVNVVLDLLWIALGIVGIWQACLAYLDLDMLNFMFVKDKLLIRPELLAEVKSQVSRHFEEKGKRRVD